MPNWLWRLLLVLVVAMALLAVAFINGYPLVYPDTGTYLRSGWSNYLPPDRPIFYGWFVRHISLATSPWLVVGAQSIIVSWLLLKISALVASGRQQLLVYSGCSIILVLTTAVSFHVSILIPDIFSSVGILSAIVLCWSPSLNMFERIIGTALFVFSLATHLSNLATWLILAASLITIAGIGYLLKGNQSLLKIVRSTKWVPGSILVTLLLVPGVNYMVDDAFTLSTGSHVFMVNHLNDIGLLVPYLEKNCADKDFQLCAHIEDINDQFLWSADSPLYLTGGWKANKDEYNAILSDVFSNPNFYPALLSTGFRATVDQFATFDLETPTAQLEDSAPYGQMQWRFPASFDNYLTSKQNQHGWRLDTFNGLQYWMVWLSMAAIGFVLSVKRLRKALPSSLVMAIAVVLLYLVINAIVCGNLSTPSPRLQNRIVWLVPLFAMLIGAWMLLQAQRTSKPIETYPK